jgi:hypothetical protein
MSTNEQVIAAWAEGQRARGGSLSTDGETLFSYALPIGYTFTGNKRAHVVIRYKVSQTTSTHINQAARVPEAIVLTPAQWQAHPLIQIHIAAGLGG